MGGQCITKPKLEFYYFNQSPPSQVVWMVLKELELEYEARPINFWIGEAKTEEYTSINPYQQVPAIKDGDFTLSESRAIAMYLCRKYEPFHKKCKLYPNSSLEEEAQFQKLMFRDIDNYNNILKYLNKGIIYGTATSPREDAFDLAKGVIDEYDKLLSRQKYMFGNYMTFLDFCAISTVNTMETTGYEIWGPQYPNLTKWRDNLAQLPYFEECQTEGTKLNKEAYLGALGRIHNENYKKLYQ